jgi:hypothetical protein
LAQVVVPPNLPFGTSRVVGGFSEPSAIAIFDLKIHQPPSTRVDKTSMAAWLSVQVFSMHFDQQIMWLGSQRLHHVICDLPYPEPRDILEL